MEDYFKRYVKIFAHRIQKYWIEHSKLFRSLTFKSYIKTFYSRIEELPKHISKALYISTFESYIKILVLGIKKLPNHILKKHRTWLHLYCSSYISKRSYLKFKNFEMIYTELLTYLALTSCTEIFVLVVEKLSTSFSFMPYIWNFALYIKRF